MSALIGGGKGLDGYHGHFAAVAVAAAATAVRIDHVKMPFVLDGV